MKNIAIITLEKYADPDRYRLVEDGVYEDKNDRDESKYRIAFAFELEEGDDTQYPLEDVLDTYFLYVTDFVPSDSEKVMIRELGGELEDVRNVKAIAGKRVFNEEYDKDGQTYIRLAIS